MTKKPMMTGRELILRIGLRMRQAAAALCERLYRWPLTKGVTEYLAVRIARRIAISEIHEIRNAPFPKEEDRAHLALLQSSLANLEKVQAGEMSLSDLELLDEAEGPEMKDPWYRLMVRLEEIRDHPR